MLVFYVNPLQFDLLRIRALRRRCALLLSTTRLTRRCGIEDSSRLDALDKPEWGSSESPLRSIRTRPTPLADRPARLLALRLHPFRVGVDDSSPPAFAAAAGLSCSYMASPSMLRTSVDAGATARRRSSSQRWFENSPISIARSVSTKRSPFKSVSTATCCNQFFP